jgi:hypothetical protein
MRNIYRSNKLFFSKFEKKNKTKTLYYRHVSPASLTTVLSRLVPDSQDSGREVYNINPETGTRITAVGCKKER